MIAKFKRPDMYLNHGVWIFREEQDYPVKAKIIRIIIEQSMHGFSVKRIFVEGCGWLDPDSVSMTRREALIDHIRLLQKDNSRAREDLEYQKALFERQERQVSDVRYKVDNLDRRIVLACKRKEKMQRKKNTMEGGK